MDVAATVETSLGASDGQGGISPPRQDAYTYFRHFNPVASAGYSMWLYDITPDDALRVRQEHDQGDAPGVNLEILWEGRAAGRGIARAIAVAPNGQGYLIGGDDGTLRVVESAMSPRYIDEHASENRSQIWALASSREAGLVASGHANGETIVYASDDDGILRHMRNVAQPQHAAAVRALAFSADGARLASAAEDGAVLVWETQQWRLLCRIQCGISVTSVGWIDNERLVVGTGDWRIGQRGWLRKYDSSGRMLEEFDGSRHFIIDLLVTPNKEVIARGSSGGLTIWDGQSGARKIELFDDGSRPLALSPDNRWLAAGDSRGMLRLWNTNTWDLVYEIIHIDSRVLGLVFEPQHHSLIAIASDGEVKHFSIKLIERAQSLEKMSLSEQGER